MRSPQLGSVVIYVPNQVRQVLDFYTAAFGLRLKHFDEKFEFGELDTGATSIAVASHAAGAFMVGACYASAADGYPKNLEIALLMDDVPGAFLRAVDAGCTPLCSPKTMPWGQTVAYVRSIEGTLVGLLTPPPSPNPESMHT